MQTEHVSSTFLSPKEVEQLYGIPLSTLAHWRMTGEEGPSYYRIGVRTIKYRRSEVEQWLKTRHVS